MRVLLMESDPFAADEASRRLRSEQHSVTRCFEPDLPSFPCAALLPDGHCPLDTASHDVAVIVRDRPWPSPTALERGAVCAIRAGVPLIVLARGSKTPWTPWAKAVVTSEDELTEACARLGRGVRTQPTPVFISPHATVREARSALAANRQPIGLVGEPGKFEALITLDKLRAAPDASDAVGDVATVELVELPSVSADPLTTLRTYSAAAWRGLRRRRPGAGRGSEDSTGGLT